MNILFVAELFYPRVAGGELVTWNIMTGLAQRGHAVYVVTCRLPSTSEYEELNNVKIFRPYTSDILKSRKFYLFYVYPIKTIVSMYRLYFYLIPMVKRNNIDIIFNMGQNTALVTSAVAKKEKLPSLNSVHSMFGNKWFSLTNPISATINYFSEKLINQIAKFDAIHTPINISPHNFNILHKVRLYEIPNPININEIRQKTSETDVEQLRGNLGIQKEELFLLIVGALVNVKNIESMISVVAKSTANFKLIIIGEGPRRKPIEKIIKNLKMHKKIRLLGHLPHTETLSIIKSCDILLVPSKSEMFSNVVWEGLGLGKVVISTKVGIVPKIKSSNLYLVDNIREINTLIEQQLKSKPDNTFFSNLEINTICNQYEAMLTEIIKLKK
jgi:glycosyltransferase involved in cell wall biosynthesis